MGEPSVISRDIVHEGGGGGPVQLEVLGGGLFRLLESVPFGWDLGLLPRAVIRCVEEGDDALRFVEIVSPSRLRMIDRVLPQEIAASGRLRAWLDGLEARGWLWERDMGGLLLVYVPAGAEAAAGREIDRVLGGIAREVGREGG